MDTRITRGFVSQDIVPQPQFLQVSWRKAFHDNVVSGEQARQQVAASGVCISR